MYEFHFDFRKKFKGLALSYVNDQFTSMTSSLQNGGFKAILQQQ